MPQETLQSSVEVQKKDLRGIVEVEDEEDFEVLGFCEWASTGQLLVPRAWLQEKWDEYDLPEYFFPSEVWPSSCYKRTMNHLREEEFEEMWIDGRKAKFRMEDGDGYVKHIYLDIFFPEEEIGVQGGDWRKTNLGFFDYDAVDQSLEFYTEAEGEIPEKEWKKLVGKSQGLYKKIKRSHNGQDLNGVILDFVKENSTAVPLRDAGAVYFFPAQYENVLEGLSQLWDDLNQYKEKGSICEVVTLPVVDSEKHRELVRRRAEELINSRTETVIDNAVDRLSEDSEETAEEIAEGVIEELSDMNEIVAEYSALLETKLSVQRHIRQHMKSLEGEKEELVEEIMEGVDV